MRSFILRKSKRLDQPRDEGRAARDVADDDVLVFGVSARAVHSQSVKNRDPERRDEIAIRSAADRSLFQLESDFGRKPLRAFEQSGGLGRSNHRRPVDPASHLDPRSLEHRLQPLHRLGYSRAFFDGLKSQVDVRSRFGGKVDKSRYQRKHSTSHKVVKSSGRRTFRHSDFSTFDFLELTGRRSLDYTAVARVSVLLARADVCSVLT